MEFDEQEWCFGMDGLLIDSVYYWVVMLEFVGVSQFMVFVVGEFLIIDFILGIEIWVICFVEEEVKLVVNCLSVWIKLQ